jgi:hypothetical protein
VRLAADQLRQQRTASPSRNCEPAPVTHQGYYCATPNPTYTGTASQKILAAAQHYLGFSTKNISGTNHGKDACAYMVNRILQDAIGRGYGDGFSVPTLVDALDVDTANVQKLGTNASLAQPGDIVVEDGTDKANEWNPSSDAYAHIGICANSGCSEIYSNSTSQTQFMNNFHDSNFNLPSSEPSTFYHIDR